MEAGRTVWEAEELAGMREGGGFWAKATTDYRGSKTRDMLSSLSIVRAGHRATRDRDGEHPCSVSGKPFLLSYS